MKLLTVEDLSALIHKSPAAIQADANRAPHRLPPILRLPGSRRLLWREEDVEAWVTEAYEKMHVAEVTRKGGRPRKWEVVPV